MMQGFAINTATLGFQCPIEKSIDAIAAHGFAGIAPWRREIEGQNVSIIAKRIRDAGLKVTGYCRSTYFPSLTREGLHANIESNRRALDDAAVLGANSFVMVVGGLPKGSKDIAVARAHVVEGTAQLLEYGKSLGVRIALEPLHPVYTAERSCLTLLSEALEMCQQIEGAVAVSFCFSGCRVVVACIGVSWGDAIMPRPSAAIQRPVLSAAWLS